MKTPRTDKAIFKYGFHSGKGLNPIKGEGVSPDFARELERELSDSKNRNKQLVDKLVKLTNEIAAKKVQSEWDKWKKQVNPFESGKQWNTGDPWVCEEHPEFPYEQGYSFDCQCGAPGMPPLPQL
jgi:hypothetical protein